MHLEQISAFIQFSTRCDSRVITEVKAKWQASHLKQRPKKKELIYGSSGIKFGQHQTTQRKATVVGIETVNLGRFPHTIIP